MLLGLDLQGGVHFLMQVDQKAALDKRFEAYRRRHARAAARQPRRATPRSSAAPDGAIVATLAPDADVDARRRQLIAQEPADAAPATIAGQPRSLVRIPQSRAAARSPPTRSSRTSARCATASTNSAWPSRSSSARAPTASWCSCRACRTPRRPSASSAPPRRWNTAAWSKATPTTRSPAATCRRKRASITARSSARTASPCRSCSTSA